MSQSMKVEVLDTRLLTQSLHEFLPAIVGSFNKPISLSAPVTMPKHPWLRGIALLVFSSQNIGRLLGH